MLCDLVEAAYDLYSTMESQRGYGLGKVFNYAPPKVLSITGVGVKADSFKNFITGYNTPEKRGNFNNIAIAMTTYHIATEQNKLTALWKVLQVCGNYYLAHSESLQYVGSGLDIAIANLQKVFADANLTLALNLFLIKINCFRRVIDKLHENTFGPQDVENFVRLYIEDEKLSDSFITNIRLFIYANLAIKLQRTLIESLKTEKKLEATLTSNNIAPRPVHRLSYVNNAGGRRSASPNPDVISGTLSTLWETPPENQQNQPNQSSSTDQQIAYNTLTYSKT